MDRRKRAGWQAGLLFCLVAVDGVVAHRLGGPAWLIPLYGALALSIAAGRLWLAPRPAARPVLPVPPVTEPATVALGDVWVPEPGDGALDEPAAAIERCCAERGLVLCKIVHDSARAGSEHTRPALAWALEQIAKGQAAVLVVLHLRDLSTNVANLPPLLSWFEDAGRTLIAIDLGIDTSTDAGRLAAGALAGVGDWEHERQSERTRRGLEAARSRGGGTGPTSVADVPELQERIAAMRQQGMTLQAIADCLNEEGVPTLRGGAKWRPSSVQRATGYRRPSAQPRGVELPRSGAARGQRA